ncbi:hypothetical protein M752DRAFT_292241 [Aspergillus phoenicis ATCC 13157]|uniref:Uncharacterized protein n=2 Tax=Aspergillus TaxID=5052 RepID=A0A370PPH3_ASPPH|nr:hypothetical protein M747DRAFT_58594 [Aspergillus niger ATCC 13496]RDK44083.1 hypothetical protein M752DRAFT_292241 [Aspergillus phoenicis ATCC 13157]
MIRQIHCYPPPLRIIVQLAFFSRASSPSSALALPVRPRDRGWSCERPEPARQFLQVFGPTIADYQTLVNDRLNLRWVQEPSKTTRRTIWMLFPPPTNWGIRSPVRISGG